MTKAGEPRHQRGDFLRIILLLLFCLAPSGFEAGAQPTAALASGADQSLSMERSADRQLSIFGAAGLVPDYNIHTPDYHFAGELDFVNAGVIIGRTIKRPSGPGFLRGALEGAIEITPFWLARYPKQTDALYVGDQLWGKSQWGPYNRFGASITPVLLRWNFIRRERPRMVPWAQLGGGLLWTNHKFPLQGGSTSVINFTPQVGIGESYFVKKNRSLDFAVKAVHISNAGLGDHNPGLNVTLQFSAGYSWWWK